MINIKNIRIGLFVGFGYWKETYAGMFEGYAHNILFMCIKIQIGKFGIKKIDS